MSDEKNGAGKEEWSSPASILVLRINAEAASSEKKPTDTRDGQRGKKEREREGVQGVDVSQ